MKPKFLLLIVLSAIIFTGLIGAITFQNIFPTTTPYVTSDDTVNLSYGIHAGDGLSSITHSWNGTNTTLWDYTLLIHLNLDNRSSLGENDTIFKDISMYNNNGTVVGGENVSFVYSGKYNGAINLNGQPSACAYTTDFDNGEEFSELTITAWVKGYDSADNDHSIASKARFGGEASWQFRASGGLLTFFINGANGTTSSSARKSGSIEDDGLWHFVVAQYNATGGFVFVDNVVGSMIGSNTGNIKNTVEGLNIGCRGLNDNWNGTIDEVMVWNRSLSYAELLEVHKTQITKFNSTYYEYNTTDKTLSISYQSSFLCSTNLTGNTFCSTNQLLSKVNTLKANFSTSMGTIRSDFYGTNIQRYSMGYSDYSFMIDTNGDGTYDSLTDFDWHKQALLNSGMTYFREYADMSTLYSNQTVRTDGVYFTGNLTKQIAEVKWAYENGKRVLLTVYIMPTWLANSSSMCYSDNKSCPPNNYTIWNNIVLDAINRVTSNGLYASAVDIEIWNEPLYDEWLINLTDNDDLLRGTEYVKLYNSTRIAIKSVYPNMAVGGPAIEIGFWTSAKTTRKGTKFLDTFLSNMTTEIDFLTLHDYGAPRIWDNYADIFYNNTEYVLGRCTIYSANCSRIIISEWNVGSGAGVNIKNDSSLESNYSMHIASGYIGGLRYPENLSMQLFQWSELTKYGNYPTYPEYPQKWSMVSEPQLDNTYYPPYNVTKNFAHLCPAGATVYVSSGDDDSIKQVSCKKGNMYSLIVINTDTNAKNITVNMTNNTNSKIFPYTSIMNYETGASIPVSTSGIAQLGVLDSYEVLYLVGDGQAPTITINSPTGSVINVVNYWFNVTLDEEGSWCGYSINGGTNVTMTQQGVLSQFKYLANIPNGFNIVTFYCNDTYGNMATASTYITGLTPSGAGTPTEEPVIINKDYSSGAVELSLWDKIVAKLTEITENAREELLNTTITGQTTNEPKEKTFMETYIWLFIGLFLFMILVLAGRKGRL